MYHPTTDTWSALRTVFDSVGVGSPAFRDRASTLLDAVWPRLLVEQRRAALFAHEAGAIAAVVAEPGHTLHALIAGWRVTDPFAAAVALEYGALRLGIVAAVLPRPRVGALVASAWPRLSAAFERASAPGGTRVVFVTAAGTELIDLALGDADPWAPRVLVEGQGEFAKRAEQGATRR